MTIPTLDNLRLIETAISALVPIPGTRWHDCQRSTEWYARNHAVPGPGGLARHKIDGLMCIAHGDGTYDIMRGESK